MAVLINDEVIAVEVAHLLVVRVFVQMLQEQLFDVAG